MNVIVCKDNLAFSKTIDSDSIDLIYCDILYGTGSDFKDYKDIKCDLDIVIDFYKERIIEYRRILKESGVVCLQMDFRISHYMRFLMENIFGIKNFLFEKISLIQKLFVYLSC